MAGTSVFFTLVVLSCVMVGASKDRPMPE